VAETFVGFYWGSRPFSSLLKFVTFQKELWK
jgi:hypothetical protein